MDWTGGVAGLGRLGFFGAVIPDYLLHDIKLGPVKAIVSLLVKAIQWYWPRHFAHLGPDAEDDEEPLTGKQVRRGARYAERAIATLDARVRAGKPCTLTDGPCCGGSDGAQRVAAASGGITHVGSYSGTECVSLLRHLIRGLGDDADDAILPSSFKKERRKMRRALESMLEAVTRLSRAHFTRTGLPRIVDAIYRCVAAARSAGRRLAQLRVPDSAQPPPPPPTPTRAAR